MMLTRSGRFQMQFTAAQYMLLMQCDSTVYLVFFVPKMNSRMDVEKKPLSTLTSTRLENELFFSLYENELQAYICTPLSYSASQSFESRHIDLFFSSICDDYDLCSSCESGNSVAHNINHPLIAIRYPPRSGTVGCGTVQ